MSAPSRTLSAEILEATGIAAATCYQCGKCSAGCPMASESALRPHNVLRSITQDRREQLLADPSLWLCLTCETCSARCPNGCDPARVIEALRDISVAEGVADQPRLLAAFHKAFLAQIKLTGRLHEVYMVMEYKLRSGDLIKDVANAPGMLTRGKLGVLPERIKGVSEIKRIFSRCGVKP